MKLGLEEPRNHYRRIGDEQTTKRSLPSSSSRRVVAELATDLECIYETDSFGCQGDPLQVPPYPCGVQMLSIDPPIHFGVI